MINVDEALQIDHAVAVSPPRGGGMSRPGPRNPRVMRRLKNGKARGMKHPTEGPKDSKRATATLKKPFSHGYHSSEDERNPALDSNPSDMSSSSA